MSRSDSNNRGSADAVGFPCSQPETARLLLDTSGETLAQNPLSSAPGKS